MVASLMEPWVIALVSAIASGCVTVIGSAYWFGRNNVTKDDLMKATADTANEIHDLRDSVNSHERNVGETVHGIREKIKEVELYVRDTYVRRDSWHQAMNQLQESIGKSDAAAEQRMLRIEEKIDRLGERLVEHPASRR